VPIWLTIQLVVVAVVLLAFGFRSTGGAIRFLTGGAALLIAIAGTAGAIGLFWLGQKNHWTSDGPGMLFVMIALGLCALAAVVGWIFVFGIASTRRAPVDALPDVPSDTKRALRLAGFALLAIVAIGQAITAFAGRGRAAHAAPVVAVSFAGGSSRLVTADAAGTVVDWDLHLRREDRRQAIPELAGTTELFVDSSADDGFAIANGQAVHFKPFANRPVETIPDARHIARGKAVVIARDRALLFVSYSDWTKPPYHELAWPEPITAIAAKDMYVAVADRARVSVLDGRPGSVRTLGSVPAPGAINRVEALYDGSVLALDGSGAAWAIDFRRGVTEPLPAKASLVADWRYVFFVSGREVSEYDPRKKTATEVGAIGSGARSIDTWNEMVAFGFDGGEVVLGTRSGARLETMRLTARPAGRQ
jgi:hypothetical protein